MMAEQRRIARTRGKSDPIDALAVARAVLREPDLPVASHDEASRELKLLVDHRDDLVAQRTQVINRFRWHLHRIDPTVDPAPKALNRAGTRAQLTEFLTGLAGIDARLARELLTDIDALTVRVNALEKEILALARIQAPTLLKLPGCGALTAAKIIGETARIARFAHEAKYAMHAGVAPIPVWSGRTAGRVRLCKSGNRQLNAALHRIAVTQIRLGGLGKACYDKRLAAGNSKAEALRCLKRRLARVVFNTLKNNPSTAATTQLTAAARHRRNTRRPPGLLERLLDSSTPRREVFTYQEHTHRVVARSQPTCLVSTARSDSHLQPNNITWGHCLRISPIDRRHELRAKRSRTRQFSTPHMGLHHLDRTADRSVWNQYITLPMRAAGMPDLPDIHRFSIPRVIRPPARIASDHSPIPPSSAPAIGLSTSRRRTDEP
jgi:transposase